MRNKKNQKIGALSVEQCVESADKLIAEYGECLFLVDIINATDNKKEMRTELYKMLKAFTEEVNELFSEYLPPNNLAVGTYRTETGFYYFLGDGTWAGINDSAVISKIIQFKNDFYPDLPLHYGVAKDGWAKEMSLVK